ncbi:MAG: RluA family pseudouridine synthase [Deltaproteobacteria bacterium]|jgi:23S rRNA pseudouridine955/2504/2580 synthase|nr:RluA family pseudouridine synthase [Deltaproteobacteria bacterium]
MLTVRAEEAGQKLLQFLARRLGLARNMFHRWIRTGQVRRNGARAGAFDRVAAGDNIRVPPFALRMAGVLEQGAGGEFSRMPLAPLLEIVAKLPDLLVVNKPAGLPVQPGSGHTDSVASRLAAHFAHLPFKPTPAHRLDKDSSGLLLAATSYERLRALHDAFALRTLKKTYLAWVEGAWTEDGLCTLRDLLEKAGAPGLEKVRSGQGREALCEVACLRKEARRSLLCIHLLTGRTHQIRAQLSTRGHPVCGDVKYGAHPRRGGLLLHAFSVALPDGERFICPPPWTGIWAMEADYAAGTMCKKASKLPSRRRKQ